MERSPSHAKFARHVDGWAFAELDNAARALEDLQRHPGWAVLQGILDAERALVEAKLDHADVPLDQATYALLHGRRGALTSPRDALEAVLVKHRDRKARLEAEPELAMSGR